MARVSGPLFSMSASGTIGKAVTYGAWKGREWCRVWFKPQNPRTVKQVNLRTAMRLIVAYWPTQTEGYHEGFDAYAAPFGMSGVNKVVSRAIKAYMLDPGIEVLPTSVVFNGLLPPDDIWTWTGPA